MGRLDDGALRAALRAVGRLEMGGACGRSAAERAAWRALGLARLAEGDAAAATDVLGYVCLLDPEDPAAWDAVAAARLAAGDDAAARTATEIAAALEPTWGRAAVAALCCDRTGDADGLAFWRERAAELGGHPPAAAPVLARLGCGGEGEEAC